MWSRKWWVKWRRMEIMEYVNVVVVDAGYWHVLDKAGICGARIVEVRRELRCSLDLHWVVTIVFSGLARDDVAFVIQAFDLA